ncbi:hypothetical protein G6F31_017424 [Rhizopus arrhizus]|nr:hypothetical protein G6F31_017424 [Rhizopus arrhizus]
MATVPANTSSASWVSTTVKPPPTASSRWLKANAWALAAIPPCKESRHERARPVQAVRARAGSQPAERRVQLDVPARPAHPAADHGGRRRRELAPGRLRQARRLRSPDEDPHHRP